MKYLNKPFELPNGSILPNRIAKSAMSENLANSDHSASEQIIRAYDTWAKGGVGLNITGNVMIDSRALNAPRNIVIEDRSHFDLLQKWAAVVKGTDSHLWVQINHPGRQTTASISKETVGPSAVPLNMKSASFMFKEPTALTEEKIWDIIERFGNTALIVKDAGFTGVQIHGAHGYLVSQFLSPISNIREDKWGGSLENRVRFLIEVYNNIRAKVGADFPIGIKLNSADFQRGGFTEEESMEVVKILSSLSIDLIEISGGTYEKAAMMGSEQKESTQKREAYFMDYIKKVRKLTTRPLMLTGGFRTAAVMDNAIRDGELDIIGLARPFSLYPDFPNQFFNNSLSKIELPIPKTGIKAIDKMGFVDLLWHEAQIKRIGNGKSPDPNLSAFSGLANNIGGTIKKMFFKK